MSLSRRKLSLKIKIHFTHGRATLCLRLELCGILCCKVGEVEGRNKRGSHPFRRRVSACAEERGAIGDEDYRDRAPPPQRNLAAEYFLLTTFVAILFRVCLSLRYCHLLPAQTEKFWVGMVCACESTRIKPTSSLELEIVFILDAAD